MTVTFTSLRARLLRIAIVLLPIVVGAPRAYASLYVLRGAEKLAEEADVVALGEVLDEKAVWIDNRIVTNVQMSVEGTLKGLDRTTVTFQVAGGKVGDVRMQVSTAPSFTIGERSMVFLKATNEDPKAPVLHMYGGAEGKIPILRDAAGNDTVQWYRLDLGRVDIVSVAAFSQHIRDTLAHHLLDAIKRGTK